MLLHLLSSKTADSAVDTTAFDTKWNQLMPRKPPQVREHRVVVSHTKQAARNCPRNCSWFVVTVVRTDSANRSRRVITDILFVVRGRGGRCKCFLLF